MREVAMCVWQRGGQTCWSVAWLETEVRKRVESGQTWAMAAFEPGQCTQFEQCGHDRAIVLPVPSSVPPLSALIRHSSPLSLEFEHHTR